MKRDMFSDLNTGDSSKYRDFNNTASLRERANLLDKKIAEASEKEKNVSWATEIIEFYNHTKTVDADVWDLLMNAGMLERLKRDADYTIEKDKADREANAEHEAAETDAFVLQLNSAQRSIYWCDDVEKADGAVKALPARSRAMCKSLAMLEMLKAEVPYIREAALADKKIKELSAVATKDEKWASDVLSVSVTDSAKPYVTECVLLDAERAQANEILEKTAEAKRQKAAQIEAERKQEDERKAKIKAEAEEKAKAKAAADAAAAEAAEAATKKAGKVNFIVGELLLLVLTALEIVFIIIKRPLALSISFPIAAVIWVVCYFMFQDWKEPSLDEVILGIALIFAIISVPFVSIRGTIKYVALSLSGCGFIAVLLSSFATRRMSKLSENDEEKYGLFRTVMSGSAKAVYVLGVMSSVAASLIFFGDEPKRYIVMGVGIFVCGILFDLVNAMCKFTKNADGAQNDIAVYSLISAVICAVVFAITSCSKTNWGVLKDVAPLLAALVANTVYLEILGTVRDKKSKKEN